MTNEKLHDLLRQLQAELGRTGEVDAESQAVLKDLRKDIARMLEKPVANAHVGAQHESLAEDLRGAIGWFEASHPDLTALMNRVCDVLSDMGI